MFLFHKGVLWLLLATMAEVPPVVSLAGFLSPFRSCLSYTLGFHCLGLEWC